MISVFFGEYFIWIGLNSLHFDKLMWSDGSEVEYFNWDVTQPNGGLNRELCIKVTKYGKWFDSPCAYQHSFLCKKPSIYKPQLTRAISTTPIPGNCPPEWHKYGSKCYKLLGANKGESKSWEDAKKDCIHQFGPQAVLVSIHSDKEQNYLISMLIHVEIPVWIGLRYETNYWWSDSTEYDYSNQNPQHRMYSFSDYSNQCFYMGLTENMIGMWQGNHCNTKYAYICQVNSDSSIPFSNHNKCPNNPSYIMYDENCFGWHDQPMTWKEGVQFCRSQGGELASINNIYEYAFVSTVFQRDVNYWIGLNAIKKKGNYEWISEEPVLFTKWEGEAADRSSECILVTTGQLWKDAFCEQKLPVLCKIFNKSPVTISPIMKGHCPNTSSEWLNFEDSCFLFKKKRTSFSNAMIECERYNGKLTSFTSLNEMYSVLNYTRKLNEPLWIGLLRTPMDGFQWLDGKPITFTNWQSGHPSNMISFVEENCVQMLSDRTWYETKCKYERAFICRADKDMSLIPRTEKLHLVQSGVNEVKVLGICLAVFITVLTLILLFIIYKKFKNPI